MTEQKIKNEIEAFIHSPIENWYVGISKNAGDRLKEHGVELEPANTSWIFRKAASDAIARSIEKYFIEKGADGGDGGGTNCLFVYAYLKTSSTKP